MITALEQIKERYSELYFQKYGRTDTAYVPANQFVDFEELAAREWGDRKVFLIQRENQPDLFAVGYESEEIAEEQYLLLAGVDNYLGIFSLECISTDSFDELRLDREYVRDARGRFAKTGSSGAKSLPANKAKIEAPERINSKTNIAQLKAIADKHGIATPKNAHRRASWHEAIKGHEEGGKYFEKAKRSAKATVKPEPKPEPKATAKPEPKPEPKTEPKPTVPSDLTTVQGSKIKKLVDDGHIKPAKELFNEDTSLKGAEEIQKELLARAKSGKGDQDDVHAALYRAAMVGRVKEGYNLNKYEFGEQLLWYKDSEQGVWIKGNNSKMGTLSPEMNEHVRQALGYNLSKTLERYSPQQLADIAKARDSETLRKFLDITGSERPPLTKPEAKTAKPTAKPKKTKTETPSAETKAESKPKNFPQK